MTENICPKMATINEASKITGLAKYFIRQLAITNRVKTVKAGNKYLINIDKLIEYLNGDNNEPKSENNTAVIKKIEK